MRLWPRPAPVTLDGPAVAVASLTRRGSGKTPMVIALAQRLGAEGPVHVVMSGPGAPLRVSERDHRAEDVGDEALLAAAFGPAWIAADPTEGLRAALDAGARRVIVEEDGDALLAAPVRILVEDAVRGFGNGRARPFGPLREPLRDGLARADLLVTLGPKAAQDRFAPVSLPRLRGHLAPLQTGMDWTGLPVLAFAGIGIPERFFATLGDLGARVIRAQPLSDHQEMTPTLLARLDREAAMAGAQLVTTEKDAVRLPPAFRPRVLVVPVRLELDDWAPLDRLLAARLA